MRQLGKGSRADRLVRMFFSTQRGKTELLLSPKQWAWLLDVYEQSFGPAEDGEIDGAYSDLEHWYAVGRADGRAVLRLVTAPRDDVRKAPSPDALVWGKTKAPPRLGYER